FGKPVCDYDDPAARQALVKALAGDAMALLAALDGRELDADVSQAAQLLGTVVGQDLDHDGQDGVLRIARRVAKDRAISTVDPDAAYGAGSLLARLEQAGASIHTKVASPVAPGGRFTKDAFTIDL